MKIYLLTIILNICCIAVSAQQKLSFSVLEFEQDVFDTSAKSTEHGMKDGNGSWYAIIKVTSNNSDDDITACQFNFGNMASKVEKHDEALWVYVQRNAKKVTISRPGYHTINQYDLQTTIEAGANYKMILTSDRVQQQVVYDVKMQMVKFVTFPAVKGAVVMATNQATGTELAVGVTDENGVVYKTMDNGRYSYRIMSTDNMYHPSEGIMTLTGSDETHEEKVILRPNYADIALSTLDDAEILINNEMKGYGSWQGRLTQGTYIITTRKENHRDSQQRLVVEEGKAQTIQLTAPAPIVGTLNINSVPYEAEITIDGKDYGKAPRIIKNMIIGQHRIEMRKSGYEEFSTTVGIEEGKITDINAELQKITDLYYGKSAKELYDLGEKAYEAKDYTTAISLFQKAADQGNAEAQNYLGYMYQYALGVTQDYTKVLSWYRKSAEQGYAHAQRNLGLCYAYGRGVPQDSTKAVNWLQMAADQGHVYSQNSLGDMYFLGNSCVARNYTKAVYWYQKAADLGDTYGQTQLGYMYDAGFGVTRNANTALYWYQKAADQGDAYAQAKVGDMYYVYSKGLTQDYFKAVYWYQKSADQGDAYGQYSLGKCYEFGMGVEKSIHQAKIWYKKAADQGEFNATRALKKLCQEYGE